MTRPETAKRSGGRPAFSPTAAQRQTVEAMAGCGIPEDEISAFLDVAPKTLRKHFRVELDTGHIKANAKVASNLYRLATGSGREAVTAAIFWLKTRAGWSEPASIRQYPLGKKELHEIAARTMDASSDWGTDLLTPQSFFSRN